MPNNKVKPKLGEIFGKLAIIEIFKENNLTKIRCLCECGQTIVTKYSKLRGGDKKSCGCLFRSLQPSPLVVGDKFGELTYIGNSNKKSSDRVLFGKYQCSCGEVFETANTSVRHGKTKTCGCSRVKIQVGGTYHKLTIIEITNDRDKNGSVIVKCQCSCGKICYQSGSRVCNGIVKSCGCLVKEINTKLCAARSGSNHYKWKNDRESVSKRIRHQMKSFTSTVLNRDSFTCQKCHRRGGDLVAHHLDGYNWCVEKRREISNGITLCEKCHHHFHLQYGFGDNTKKQFDEFMETNNVICII